MEFHEMKALMQEHFKLMAKNASHLFAVDVDKDELWNAYLDSFPDGTNEIYRERREHDCSCCRNFIKGIGNAVAINDDNELVTIWDFKTDDTTYQLVIEALSAYVKSKAVRDIYFSKYEKVGVDKNFEKSDNGNVQEWHHFYLKLPEKFVNNTGRTMGDIAGEYRDTKNVFMRSLEEITRESLLTVLELISQNSLYKGEEWERTLKEFLKHKKKYEELETEKEKNNYAWLQSTKVGGVVGRIRNHSMGVLLTDISEGVELDVAVRKYEAIVAPTNYKRPKPIFTKKMLEDAKKTIDKLGYLESLNRRYATLDDITVNNILYSNKDSAKRIAGNVFDEMMGDAVVKPKKFSKVDEIQVEDFVKNVLPSAKELEIYFEGKHMGNMVSLIAPENGNGKGMFKWNNNFSWAYTGNITDSLMKERVKSAGGDVHGVLRFSIQWNEIERDMNDLDAHCVEPGGFEIYYPHKGRRSPTGGMLDVDIISPTEGVPAVENITWANTSKMKQGAYEFFVHCYSHNGGRSGFRAEIEFDGQIHAFEYNKELRYEENVKVADIIYDGTGFSIKEALPSDVSSREIWGVKTNQFIPVSVVMYSPNYWDEQKGIGHRHYFFMLKDCVNSENPNGFYNEFLKEDLMRHKNVFEALGGKMAVKAVDDQLSGIGFSSTKRNDLMVKVKGQTERVLKIKI